MGSPRRLYVLDRAEAVAAAIYLLVQCFPKDDTAEIPRRLVGAVTSILSNIAEGAACSSPTQFSNYLSIAIRSSNQAESRPPR